VSRYLRSGANDVGAESSRAWVSVFIPGAGRVSYDPTNDVTPAEGIALVGGEQNVQIEVREKPA